jgi:hypothetical protein
MRSRSTCAIVATCLFLTAACSGDDEADHDHDADASAATEAPTTGAAGGSTGSAPTVSGDCAVPKCLATIFDQCTPAGSCGNVAVEGGVEYCYDNGVSIRSQPLPAGNMIGSYSVNKPDGERCYIMGIYTAPEGLYYEYRSSLSPDLIKATAAADGSFTVDCGSQGKSVLGAACSPDMLLSPAAEFDRCDNSMPCEMTRGFGN